MRQVGILLFSYANDQDGHYPKTLNPLISESQAPAREIKALIKDPKLIYTPPDTSISNTDKKFVLLRYPMENGDVIYTVGNEASYIRTKISPAAP
ncbi:MAG: hypothetical protein PHD76_05445 [Methylacidiphilales bacterium]|nr:hypothetical protein [Candidatus Methylacidiphilales bacterium]